MSLALGSEPTCIGKETSDSSTEPETSESEQDDIGLEDVDSYSAVIYLETGCSESWDSHSHTTMSDSSDEDNIPLSNLVSNKNRKNDSENVNNNASSDEDNIPLSNLVSNKNRKSDSKNGSDNASSDEDNIPLSNLVSNKNRKNDSENGSDSDSSDEDNIPPSNLLSNENRENDGSYGDVLRSRPRFQLSIKMFRAVFK